MSEYGDYSQKIFDESQRNSFRESSQFQGEYIDFNPDYGFNLSRIQNPDYQANYYEEKQAQKDTDITVKANENIPQPFNYVRVPRKIQISSLVKKQYLKTRKGSPYETMELNINFKTLFCRAIQELADLKILTKDQKELFLRYKFESPSFKSLNNFLNSSHNRQSKQRLKQLISDSQIIFNILKSDLKIQNKMAMIKFIEVMKITVFKGNSAQKWK